MVTITSLKHYETQRKLFVAMQRARVASLKKNVGVCVIRNKAGKVFLTIEHLRLKNGKTTLNFYTDGFSKNITSIVLTSLRA